MKLCRGSDRPPDERGLRGIVFMEYRDDYFLRRLPDSYSPMNPTNALAMSLCIEVRIHLAWTAQGWQA
jgi:hypothetical protein